ncbi:MAG: methionyl-tRNA formyltransferase [Desulfobacterales bacterium]|nr:methionyl-tRNA formyltransferase [Desulfobacterales bacterium]
MTSALNVVFMGTPGFAVPSLEALVQAGHRVSLVVTQPDRPRGRGRRLEPPAVKTAAMEAGIAVIQPEALSRPETNAAIADSGPDVIVVVAFGRILRPRMLEIARLGAVNVHGSLLPKYRGPAPIQWAIIEGEAETGITTMKMDPGLDTGDILLAAKTPIGPTETAADLHDRLAVMGADLLVETLDGLSTGTLEPIPQDHDRSTYAPMLTKADGRLDWNRPAPELNAFIRGMTPWPGAFTRAGDQRLKVFASEPLDVTTDAPAGTVIRGFADELRVATGRGVLSILEIQGASGKRMAIRDFLMGAKLPPGTVLS